MENFDNSKLRLVFVDKVGEIDGTYEYDFYFAINPDNFWGYGFDCEYANQDEAIPDVRTCDKIYRLRSTIPFFTIQENRCFSIQHAVDNIVSVAFEDISDYDEYPEPYRIVFMFGEYYDSVEGKLASRSQFFNEEDE